MKNKSIFLSILISFGVISAQVAYSEQFTQLSENEINRIADVIYKIEGGNKTKYPYGIKSIKTNNPRQICKNTIRNQYIRWQQWGKTNSFEESLAQRYCPVQGDKTGLNKNWLKNLKFWLAK